MGAGAAAARRWPGATPRARRRLEAAVAAPAGASPAGAVRFAASNVGRALASDLATRLHLLPREDTGGLRRRCLAGREDTLGEMVAVRLGSRARADGSAPAAPLATRRGPARRPDRSAL